MGPLVEMLFPVTITSSTRRPSMISETVIPRRSSAVRWSMFVVLLDATKWQEAGTQTLPTERPFRNGNRDPVVTWALQHSPIRSIRIQNLVGGPGFEPGASRSRTGRMSCPLVSPRFLQGPPVLNFARHRVLLCPLGSSWFRECVTRL